jgi:hypothetical protein
MREIAIAEEGRPYLSEMVSVTILAHFGVKDGPIPPRKEHWDHHTEPA